MTTEADMNTSVSPAVPSVTEYLTGDHRRLDAIVSEVEALVSAGAFGDAETRFAEFARGLGRHIDAEEEIVFPALEQITGMVGRGPTFVMRSEHVQMRLLLNQVAGAFAAADGAAAQASLQELTDVLANHNVKEERILYPMADQVAGSDQMRHEVVTRLQAGS